MLCMWQPQSQAQQVQGQRPDTKGAVGHQQVQQPQEGIHETVCPVLEPTAPNTGRPQYGHPVPAAATACDVRHGITQEWIHTHTTTVTDRPTVPTVPNRPGQFQATKHNTRVPVPSSTHPGHPGGSDSPYRSATHRCYSVCRSAYQS